MRASVGDERALTRRSDREKAGEKKKIGPRRRPAPPRVAIKSARYGAQAETLPKEPNLRRIFSLERTREQ